jgi:hypothetical protein
MESSVALTINPTTALLMGAADIRPGRDIGLVLIIAARYISPKGE